MDKHYRLDALKTIGALPEWDYGNGCCTKQDIELNRTCFIWFSFRRCRFIAEVREKVKGNVRSVSKIFDNADDALKWAESLHFEAKKPPVVHWECDNCGVMRDGSQLSTFEYGLVTGSLCFECSEKHEAIVDRINKQGKVNVRHE